MEKPTLGQVLELAGDTRLADADVRRILAMAREDAFGRSDIQEFIGGQLDFAGLRRRAWAHEEASSPRAYPPEYKGVRGLDEQAAILRAALPGIGDYDHAFASTLGQVQGTEGLFLIARPEKIAPSYGEAVERMFRAIADTRRFTNYRKDQLGEQYLRQHERTVAMLRRTSERQQGDLLVLPGDFGKLHAGRSMRRSRELFVPNEWGGGAFATACMILTHPTRFVRWEQLQVFCPGDEYAPGADDRFVRAPYFGWVDGGLEFYAYGLSFFYPYYGSVSFRLPE